MPHEPYLSDLRPESLCAQGNDSLPQGNLAAHYSEGVLFVTYSLLIQKGKAGALVGTFGLDGALEEVHSDGEQEDIAAAVLGAIASQSLGSELKPWQLTHSTWDPPQRRGAGRRCRRCAWCDCYPEPLSFDPRILEPTVDRVCPFFLGSFASLEHTLDATLCSSTSVKCVVPAEHCP